MTPPVELPPRRGRVAARLIGLLAVLGVAAAAAGFFVYQNTQKPTEPTDVVAKPPEGGGKPVSVGGMKLFETWPKEKPDLVIVVSGQTFGYLSPCGCSRPQTGGLERRYNLIQELKGKGWEVIGVEVGDLAPAKEQGTLREQNYKKYAFAMRALKEMGYVAVGVGRTEFQNDLFQLLGQFTVGNPNERPIVLGANLVGGVKRDKDGKVVEGSGKVREEYFKGMKGDRPLVEDVEVYKGKEVAVAVVGTVGKSVQARLADADPLYGYEDNAAVLKAALAKADKDPAKPDLRVLLYQGTEIEAKQVAKDFPGFQLILRASDDSEGLAPLHAVSFPDTNPTTQIVHVGHKGQSVGVVGVFKTPKGYDLRYQLVPLGEEYLTPPTAEAEKGHKLLQLLEKYTAEVKTDDLLRAAVKGKQLHGSQVSDETIKYAGVDACKKCHAAEVKRWGETKHSHAYEALEKLAKRPALRQYDPDCVSCHTTGFNYKTGFENEKDTKHLMNNQCENCHGPASEHVAKPNDAKYLKLLSPWKVDGKKLPEEKVLKAMAELKETERGKVLANLDPIQQKVVLNVQQMCMRCHDLDNDPKFDIWTYLPKIYHSGLKGQDLPPGVGK